MSNPEKRLNADEYRVPTGAKVELKRWSTLAKRAADAPWYVVPADDKESARLIVSEIILEVLKSLNMEYPEPTAERRRELQVIRKRLGK